MTRKLLISILLLFGLFTIGNSQTTSTEKSDSKPESAGQLLDYTPVAKSKFDKKCTEMDTLKCCKDKKDEKCCHRKGRKGTDVDRKKEKHHN